MDKRGSRVRNWPNGTLEEDNSAEIEEVRAQLMAQT